MSSLLEIREKIKVIYGRNDVYIIPVIKFLLAFLSLSMINGSMGYMSRLDNLSIVLIVSLLCSFLPVGCIIFFAGLFSLLHMYELSVEVALVGFCIYLIICLLYLRFSPKDSIIVLLTPLLCHMNIPYVMPIAAGLLGTPASVVSVGCGLVIYFYISYVTGSAQAISAMDEEETIAKIQLALNGLINNKAMLVMIIAAAVTIIVVYLIRRLPVNYSWTTAILTGSIVNLIVLLIGDLKYSTDLSMGWAVLGALLGIAVGKVIEFFRFCVDYNRAEKVQFEDDEYYYYVRALPKMTVAAQAKTVKRINTQRRSRSASGSSPRSGRSAQRSVSINSNEVDNTRDLSLEYLQGDTGDQENMEEVLSDYPEEDSGQEYGEEYTDGVYADEDYTEDGSSEDWNNV